MALCTVSDVEQVLGVDLSTTDEATVTNLLIPTVEAAISNFLGYDPKYSASITEKFDGDRTEDLFLSRSPVVSVTSVTEDGTTLTEGNGDDYVLYANLGRLRKVGRERWSNAKLQNITVVYSAGYSDSEGTAEDVPKDMKYVCARASGKLIVSALSLASQQSTGSVGTHSADSTNDSQFQLVRNEGIGDYQVTYESVLDQLGSDILQEADKKILQKYKRQLFTSAGILD
tara:strand:- start:274 stop:960 length:687 start_codon:yes stop_codon:yes gene_type:complete